MKSLHILIALKQPANNNNELGQPSGHMHECTQAHVAALSALASPNPCPTHDAAMMHPTPEHPSCSHLSLYWPSFPRSSATFCSSASSWAAGSAAPGAGCWRGAAPGLATCPDPCSPPPAAACTRWLLPCPGEGGAAGPGEVGALLVPAMLGIGRCRADMSEPRPSITPWVAACRMAGGEGGRGSGGGGAAASSGCCASGATAGACALGSASACGSAAAGSGSGTAAAGSDDTTGSVVPSSAWGSPSGLPRTSPPASCTARL
mmetsp:Transcript_23287/g.59524  ORF Transcript_23287/g.59524 Transcript_23287/m.59524 type:complete len:262 (-) Transcript_23287:520-1305(-)